MQLAVDWLGVLIAGLFIFIGFGLFRWSRHFAPPLIFFSKAGDLPEEAGILPAIKGNSARALTYAAAGCFLAAFIDPHFLMEHQADRQATPPAQGAAVYLLLDQSGSMAQTAKLGRSGSKSKLDVLKQVTQEFIQGNPSAGLQGRPKDLIGMVKFARAAQVMVPLTLDHQALIDQLAELAPVQSEEENGTAMGYAIYKTAGIIAATRHFAEDLAKGAKPAYEIKEAVIIVVTDGFPSPSPLDKGRRLRNLDLDEASQFAQDNHIRLYVVNIDPEFAASEYAPNRRLLQRVTQKTGGQFFMADGAESLAEIYAAIDRLEKSRLAEELADPGKHYRRFSLYPYLIGAGMLCLALASIFDTLIWKRMP